MPINGAMVVAGDAAITPAQVELALQRERDYSATIIAAMSEGYALTIDGQIRAVNDALCELTGFPREELLGATVPFPFWPDDALPETMAVRDRVLAVQGGTFRITLMHRSGSRFEAEITARPARHPDGTVLGYVNTVRDVSEQRRYEAELERLATHDHLTGLANHRAFHQRLTAEHELALSEHRALSVAILDLDHFKAINDRHGHLTGDETLRAVAARLSQESCDGQLLARVGGEEFAWIMPGDEIGAARDAAERARRAVAALVLPVAGSVTVSAGVCDLRHASGATQLYEYADQALYRAKRAGRNRTVRYGER